MLFEELLQILTQLLRRVLKITFFDQFVWRVYKLASEALKEEQFRLHPEKIKIGIGASSELSKLI